ncbi:Uncharacterised protein [Mycobacterium tuberculosis]|uniref:Uncharacterized protein n=1 Tax=Mycobacterium tuberculosis TaxID=1773 RepID=A0A655ELG7_MYCTX|nr:Uncharacterised protein [Mycobacterium tuberculosis]CKS89408.1 Uncharacterised protein [Mycobacterium tuberculosis]CKT07031.1 Uncharacterised protein [Mycobacterium tuberculosis]CKW08844.1 Uncharacterised protein [Mycobacterium tuberculosis]CNV25229.1 Uncharacterised protein [Mycobacterium tuberculosis]
MVSARLIRADSKFMSPERAAASASANFVVLSTRPLSGKPNAVATALATAATDAPPGPSPDRAADSSALTAPFGWEPSAQFTATHCAANASSAACWPWTCCSAAASAETPNAIGESRISLATLSGRDAA